MVDEGVDYCGDDCHNYWRARAERAEAEHEGFKGECIRRHRADLERITELREHAERAEATIREMAADALTREAQYEELERAELARDAMWEKDRAALDRVRALCDDDAKRGLTSVPISVIRAAIEGDNQ